MFGTFGGFLKSFPCICFVVVVGIVVVDCWIISLFGLFGGPIGGKGRNSGVGKFGLRGGNLLGLFGYGLWP